MRLASAFFLALSWMAVWSGAQEPSSVQEPIRVEVEAVNLLVTVIDSKGRFVTDLTRDRFKVFENGNPQELTNFTHETDLPLRIGLLIDTSASVRTKLDFEKRAAINFVHAVMRPEDRTLLAEFDAGVTMISDFTNKPARIAEQIRGLRAGGGTALLDAVYAVCRDKMTAAGVRRTIVLVSDGADLNSDRTLDETLDMVQRSGVTIYGIGTTGFGASRDKKGEEMLLKLAEDSGGRAFFPYSPDQLANAFDTINQELRSQYSLTYVPKDKSRTGKFRRLKVRLVKGKNLKVRHRKGYYAMPPAETAVSR